MRHQPVGRYAHDVSKVVDAHRRGAAGACDVYGRPRSSFVEETVALMRSVDIGPNYVAGIVHATRRRTRRTGKVESAKHSAQIDEAVDRGILVIADNFSGVVDSLRKRAVNWAGKVDVRINSPA